MLKVGSRYKLAKASTLRKVRNVVRRASRKLNSSLGRPVGQLFGEGKKAWINRPETEAAKKHIKRNIRKGRIGVKNGPLSVAGAAAFAPANASAAGAAHATHVHNAMVHAGKPTTFLSGVGIDPVHSAKAGAAVAAAQGAVSHRGRKIGKGLLKSKRLHVTTTGQHGEGSMLEHAPEWAKRWRKAGK